MTSSCEQLRLFDDAPYTRDIGLLPLTEYRIVVAISGGKDSVAALLALLESGVNPCQIELHHHLVDGDHRSGHWFFDWQISTSYVIALGEYFNIPVYMSWRDGGILKELMRTHERTADVLYEDPDGNVTHLPTTKGKYSTRRRWPAMSPDLSVRYCSAVAKIDTFRRWLNNDPRFKGTTENPCKVLVVTGERREESSNRAKYLEKEVHPCNTKSRIVHSWRNVINWSEQEVWDIFKRFKLAPNPVYNLGFSRLSCQTCVFFSPDNWAMLRHINPELFQRLVDKEIELGHTIDPRMSLTEKADKGSINRMPVHDPRFAKWVEAALTPRFRKEDLIVDGEWELPAGAFGGSGGGPV
jgi:3'-phosphoadenosine 5'-phosphosulfate sulfotransferase (PAPS reductase)/FAD synthetase